VDWKRMQRCLAPHHGPVAVLTVADYLSIHKTTSVNVTLFAALSRTKLWALQSGMHVKEFQELNSDITLPGAPEVPEEPLLRGLTTPEKPTPADVAAGVGPIQDDVITFGEMYNTGMRPKPPVPVMESPDCLNLWRCHPAIMAFVRGVGAAKLGGSYAALHLTQVSLLPPLFLPSASHPSFSRSLPSIPGWVRPIPPFASNTGGFFFSSFSPFFFFLCRGDFYEVPFTQGHVPREYALAGEGVPVGP